MVFIQYSRNLSVCRVNSEPDDSQKEPIDM